MSEIIENEVAQKQDLISKLQRWFNQNQKLISYVGAGIVGLIALFWAYNYFYKEPLEKEAANLLYSVEKAFEKDSFDAVLKGSQGNMGAIEIAEEYSGTKAGNLANYMAGVALFTKSEYDKAIDYFEDFNASDPFLGPNSIGLIGDCHAAKKEYAKAAKYFAKAGKKNINNLTTTHWLFKAGAAYEKLDKWDDAVDCYEFLKKNCKDAANTKQIDKYINYAKARNGEFKAK